MYYGYWITVLLYLRGELKGFRDFIFARLRGTGLVVSLNLLMHTSVVHKDIH